MKRIFVFESTAVVVFGWYEPDPSGEEQGVRVEVRLLGDQGHRGSRFAAQQVVVDQPLFRADLFDLVQGEPANFAHAHYHPHFDGVEPGPRHWDAALTSDPIGWLQRQLTDLEGIVTASGATGLVDGASLAADARALRTVAREIAAAAETVLAEVRASGSPKQ